MKLLRVGEVDQEIPAILDVDNKLRNISSYIDDFNSRTLNFDTIEKIKNIDLKALPEISSDIRIGSCVSRPGNFFAIGLNYKEHAEETGAKAPDYPVVFNKSVHSIVGPNDNIVIPKNSKKLDHEVEIAMVIGKKAKRINTVEKPRQNKISGFKLFFFWLIISCKDCPDTNEIYPGINGKTQGDKKLIKPAPIAMKYSVI